MEQQEDNIYELQLFDDVSSWLPGDQLVIASTDYDFEQAEEVTVIKATGNTVRVSGKKHRLNPQLQLQIQVLDDAGSSFCLLYSK